jgi:glycerophosphoryl diester phosphodiesterase
MSIFFAKNFILRWMVDSLTVWFCTPAGLHFLGADLACIEQGHVSQDLLDAYKKARIVVCAWCVNEPEQRRWLKANGVAIITDTLFDIDQQ